MPEVLIAAEVVFPKARDGHQAEVDPWYGRGEKLHVHSEDSAAA